VVAATPSAFVKRVTVMGSVLMNGCQPVQPWLMKIDPLFVT
jgi:hypothetical protein